MGTHLRALSESHAIYTNMTGFRWVLRIFRPRAKMASAVEGFKIISLIRYLSSLETNDISLLYKITLTFN